MNKNLRKVIIAGNWKMNNTINATTSTLEEMKSTLDNFSDVTVIISVPSINIPLATSITKDSFINISAQNVHFENQGAFTGEISPLMLNDYGVKYSILGHSERRSYYGETDESVNKRVIGALNNGICPIFCVGEVLEERENGTTNEVVKSQVVKGLLNVSKEDVLNVVIAYEPVWAIGTGKTATAEQAEETCGYIRSVLAEMYDETTANAISILYGGSMNAKNAKELLDMENIDGGLIGGASLKTDDFAQIIKATR